MLLPEAITALRAHDRQSWQRQRLGDEYADLGLVIASSIGTPLSARKVIREFKAALKRAGLDRSVRFHELRHAGATLMLAAGMDQKSAIVRLGHSTIRLVMDLYTHAVRALDEDAARRMERLLRKSVRS